MEKIGRTKIVDLLKREDIGQTRYLFAERRCIRRRTAYSAAGSVGNYSMLYHLAAEQYRADYQVCRKFVFPFRGNLL